MQKIIILLLVSLLGPKSFDSVCAVLNQPKEVLDITSTDIFSLNSWESSQVTVLGFKLGMARGDATRLAGRSGFKLLNSAPPKAGQECNQDLCSIYAEGRATSVHLIFGQGERVKEIRMDLYVAEAGGPMWIAQQLKGESKELAVQYSDELRLKLLGREDVYCVGNPMVPRPMVQLYAHTYSYKKRGFIFEVERVEEGYPANIRYPVVQVELSFVLPQK
jgi:hypothetical protein